MSCGSQAAGSITGSSALAYARCPLGPNNPILSLPILFLINACSKILVGASGERNPANPAGEGCNLELLGIRLGREISIRAQVREGRTSSSSPRACGFQGVRAICLGGLAPSSAI